jgi:hypothetical protein
MSESNLITISKVTKTIFFSSSLICRVMEIDRHSIAPEVNPADDALSIDEHDFVPHFQRVSISGEDTSGVPLEDLERASHLLIQALEMRERYMTISHQSFPHTTGRFVRARQEKDAHVVHHEDKKTIAGKTILSLLFSRLLTFNLIFPSLRNENSLSLKNETQNTFKLSQDHRGKRYEFVEC